MSTYRRTAAKNMHPSATSARSIPRGHEFDPEVLKPLMKVLWSLSTSLGHALNAHKLFSRMNSSRFSPDGMIGGQGYVMPIKELRQNLQNACEQISSICDALYDETSAPHWKSKLADLEKLDLEDIKELLRETKKNMEDPEGEAERDMKRDMKPGDTSEEEEPEGEEESDDEEDATEEEPKGSLMPSETVDPEHRNIKKANSSLPGGASPIPRVDHRGPGEGRGPYGYYNKGEPLVEDGWGMDEGVGYEYLYPSSINAASALPDYHSEPTKTEGHDFGIGFGAHGQGSGGYGLMNPYTGDYGVDGPTSGLPRDPGGKMQNIVRQDSNASIENEINNIHATQDSMLPGDTEEPVARSDYYTGPSGNMVRGESGLPQPDTTSLNIDRDTPNAGYTYNRMDAPYVRWEGSTKTRREDPVFE